MMVQRIRSLAAALLVVVLAGSAVAGCGGEDSSADGTGTAAAASDLQSIAYAGLIDSNPEYKAVGDRLVQLAEADDVRVTRFDNRFDATTALQNARLMVQQRPEVFVDWSGNADANAAIGRQFEQAGRPCIAVNIRIDGCHWFNLDNYALGADEGVVAAAEARRRGWSGDDTTLVMLNAPFAGPEINALVSGFYGTFSRGFPGMEQVPEDEIELTTTRIGDNTLIVDGRAALADSNRVLRQTLPTIPSDRHLIVVTLNGDSALGAQRALEQAGRSDDALIVANAASSASLDQLRRNPNWIADGSVFVEYWADYLYAMAKAVEAGARSPERTPAPQTVLTKDNVDDFYAADNTARRAPPVAPDAAYLEQYGLTR